MADGIRLGNDHVLELRCGVLLALAGAGLSEAPCAVFIALIEDPGIIRHILEHLGLWAPLPTERSPPLDPASWPRYADLPLTYHPVPDIAYRSARGKCGRTCHSHHAMTPRLSGFAPF